MFITTNWTYSNDKVEVNDKYNYWVVVVVDGGGMSRPPLQSFGKGSQIKLYLHHDLVNKVQST